MDPRVKRIVSAVLNPVSLAVGAAGSATFVLSGAWWVLPLTAAAWGAISATQAKGDVSNPAKSGLPPGYATRLHALHSLMKRIEDTLASSNDTVRACLADVPITLGEMRTKVEELLVRQSRIDAYLAEVHPQVAAAELQRLEISQQRAQTDEARAKWAAAVANKRAELDAKRELSNASDRIAAELAEIESALETTLSKIVGLEHGHAGITAEAQAGITNGLSDVLIKVSALEQALEETATGVAFGVRR